MTGQGRGFVAGAFFLVGAASGCARDPGPSLLVGDATYSGGSGVPGVDLSYVMTSEEAKLRAPSVPGGERLAEIVRQGARATLWMDALQRDVPEGSREQLWRRVDRIGHEPTPESPSAYGAQSIPRAYDDALAKAPAAVAAVIRSDAELPHAVPGGLTIAQVADSLREVNRTYSRAARYLALYDWRFSLDARSRDFRPYLRLRADRVALEADAADWSRLAPSARVAWLDRVTPACPVGGVPGCDSRRVELLDRSATPAQARDFLALALAGGTKAYERLFTIVAPHPGVSVSTVDGELQVEFRTSGIAQDLLSWIQAKVDDGFLFPGSVRLRLAARGENAVRGVVRIEWLAGALPHVNAVGGDVIVMDANVTRWQEQTQVTLTHEFGHVIGFPDCYVEFWEPANEQFVFYSLDPDDRMCALSGGTLPRHERELRGAFGGG